MKAVATMATTGVPTSAAKTMTSSVSTALITPPAQLSPREIVVDIAGNTLIATQYPAVTTGWWESVLPNGIHTWVSVVFTQTFATTVLDQLGEARSGSIGLGANVTGTVIMIDRVAEGVKVVNSTAVTSKAEDVKGWKLLGVVNCMLLFGVVLAQLVPEQI